MEGLVKPNMPVEPKLRDPKYNQPTDGPVKHNEAFSQDYKHYQIAFQKYLVELEEYEQSKLIKDIQRSSLKLCLKKYKITKR